MLTHSAGFHLAEFQFDQQQDGSHSSRRIPGGHHRLLPKSVLCLSVIPSPEPWLLFASHCSLPQWWLTQQHVCVVATFCLLCLCSVLAVNSDMISMMILRLSLRFFCRAHRLDVQQQLLWQFGVQRRGHPSSPRWAVPFRPVITLKWHMYHKTWNLQADCSTFNVHREKRVSLKVLRLTESHSQIQTDELTPTAGRILDSSLRACARLNWVCSSLNLHTPWSNRACASLLLSVGFVRMMGCFDFQSAAECLCQSAKRSLTKHAGAHPDLFVRLGEQVLSVSCYLYNLCDCSQLNVLHVLMCVQDSPSRTLVTGGPVSSLESSLGWAHWRRRSESICLSFPCVPFQNPSLFPLPHLVSNFTLKMYWICKICSMMYLAIL